MNRKINYIFLVCLFVVSACMSTKKNTLAGVSRFAMKEARILDLRKDSMIATSCILPKEIAGIRTERFSKVEIGITLPDPVSDAVYKFLTDSTQNYPNPYDPDDINVEGIFYKGKDTLVQPGFYFKDYYRDLKTNHTWKDKHTEYNWRVRFAPPDTGLWTCIVRIRFPHSNVPEMQCKPLYITCIEGDNEGYMQIADNQLNFSRSGSGKNFMAIGQNIPWPEDAFFKGQWLNGGEPPFYFPNKDFKNRLYSVGLMDIENYLQNAAQNKANLVRIVSWQGSYLYEWEERGVYGSGRTYKDENFKRQKRAWELDQLFNTAEASHIMLLFSLEFQGQYEYDWNGGDKDSYKFNPYQEVNEDGRIVKKLPMDFFNQPELKDDYKKKLRYFIARWGYSTSLGALQLLSEYDGWGTDSVKVHNHMGELIKRDPRLQQDIHDWHDEMGTYLHTIAGRPLIVTSGCTSNIAPDLLPPSRNIYNTPGIDLIISNRYFNVRSASFLMFNDAKKATDKIGKPFLYTETGLLTDPANNSDPSDLEGCSDVMFHNFLWAGSAMGNAGTSLEWWQMFDNERRKNFRSAYAFYNDINFNIHTFSEKTAWSDKGSALYYCGNLQKLVSKNSSVEAYYVSTSRKSSTPQEVYGWTHNMSYYWSNLAVYMECRDRSNHLPVAAKCNFDKYSEPVKLDPETYILVKNLKPKTRYKVLWYSTHDEGGVIQEKEMVSLGGGSLKIQWPGEDWDYAFRVVEVQTDMLVK